MRAWHYTAIRGQRVHSRNLQYSVLFHFLKIALIIRYNLTSFSCFSFDLYLKLSFQRFKYKRQDPRLALEVLTCEIKTRWNKYDNETRADAYSEIE